MICLSPAAGRADWAQSFGIGQKSSNLGQAVTATADDYDAFYTNPAGAANFDAPFIGFGVKTLDTRQLDLRQTDVQTALPGGFPILVPGKDGLDLSPEETLTNSDIAIVPSAGGYAPIPGAENIVVGIGVGVPFLVAANFGNDEDPGNYGKFNVTDAAIVVVEVSPTLAIKVNDRLNVGASVGVTTFKYLKLEQDFGTRLGTPSLASVGIETDSDVGLPVSPWEFQTAPLDVSFTLGAQYQLTDRLRVGVTYRSETPETFEGGVNVAALGFLNFEDRFKFEAELPRHLQLGLAYQATPALMLSADARWTNWSATKGFGSPAEIKVTEGNIDVFDAIGLGSILGAPVESLTINYDAQDTVSLHFGAAYKLTPAFELQMGYVYDPSFMPEDAADLITTSSNRHILSLGGEYKKQGASGQWTFNAGGQLILYEDRTIDANESATAGGVNTIIEDLLVGEPDLEYKRNILGGFDIGGYVWSVGASLSYRFNGAKDPLEPR
ncbi:MAG: outer membrane protein transport protein [Hyphomicrobiales bacterium]|nr:outer membrane protein transport protein [Hyphomicrobiales bacterium]